jgi:hypothetical protein
MATSTAKTAPAATDKKKALSQSERIAGQLKRSAVGGKISKEELEKIAELAKSLVVFVS